MPTCLDIELNDVDEGQEVELIASQTDQFRRERGSQRSIPGKWVLTAGVHAMGPVFIKQAVEAVAAFSEFTEDNDPHGERDFGVFQIDGKKLFWKVDLYDRVYLNGSPVRSDISQTARVLTILFPDEY